MARIIKRIVHGEHDVSIISESIAYPLPASIKKIDVEHRTLLLHASCEESRIKEYVAEGAISLYIKRKNENSELEVLYLEGIELDKVKEYGRFLEARCTLPQTLFTNSKSGELRVPFIQGMQANAELEIYPGVLSTKARLHHLSIDGCMLEVQLKECAVLKTGQDIPSISIEFPNGDGFDSPGIIQYIRPFGRSTHAAIGISFIEVDHSLQRRLLYFVNEAEREVAYRTGMSHRGDGPSSVFAMNNRAQEVDETGHQERADKLPPMVHEISEVAQQLHITLISLRNVKPVSESALYDCADTMLNLLKRNRQQFLYAICCLYEEPPWLRHSIHVAGLLCDFLVSSSDYATGAREAVVGALVHSMGKPLLLSEELPSLDATLTPSQRAMLKGHVETLGAQFNKVGWSPSRLCHDVIFNSNERLDGSGYPSGKRAEDLSDLARITAVIKIIDTLTNPRNKRSGLTPLEAYRWVNNHPELFDSKWLTRYIQRYGIYPIGSLVKFSGGFLAWVMELNKNGLPSRVKVVKNLAFVDVTLNTVLSSIDYSQIGSLECVVCPEDFQLSPC